MYFKIVVQWTKTHSELHALAVNTFRTVKSYKTPIVNAAVCGTEYR